MSCVFLNEFLCCCFALGCSFTGAVFLFLFFCLFVFVLFWGDFSCDVLFFVYFVFVFVLFVWDFFLCVMFYFVCLCCFLFCFVFCLMLLFFAFYFFFFVFSRCLCLQGSSFSPFLKDNESRHNMIMTDKCDGNNRCNNYDTDDNDYDNDKQK